jgi:hypothetical protein
MAAEVRSAGVSPDVSHSLKKRNSIRPGIPRKEGSGCRTSTLSPGDMYVFWVVNTWVGIIAPLSTHP